MGEFAVWDRYLFFFSGSINKWAILAVNNAKLKLKSEKNSASTIYYAFVTYFAGKKYPRFFE
jgi:hypothetical protein